MVGGSFAGPVWLVDGYAGPGTYEADDDGDRVTGSPIVALEIAEKAAQWKSPRDIRCAFIERKPNYLKQTSGERQAAPGPWPTRPRSWWQRCARAAE